MKEPPFDYEAWSEFRYQIRRYQRITEDAAADAGLEPQQHQLLLAVRGFPGGETPTIGQLAERLQLRHHTTVGLVDRMEQRLLVVRRPQGFGRAVNIELTPTGEEILDEVSRRLQPELNTAAANLSRALARLTAESTRRSGSAASRGAGAPQASSAPSRRARA